MKPWNKVRKVWPRKKFKKTYIFVTCYENWNIFARFHGSTSSLDKSISNLIFQKLNAIPCRPKQVEKFDYLTLEKNKVCSFDIETLDLTYMSPCQNFIAYLTLPWLMLAFTVRCVDQAAGKDQNTLMWT